ncbi:MAG: hypothetical protein IJA41_03760 [Clostridia bacterium]|nr:hypothetical protein [Clostridia bacterium]
MVFLFGVDVPDVGLVVCAVYDAVPVIKVGVQDTFGMSGPANDLLGIFGLRAKDIVEKAKQAIAAKK